MNKYKNEDKKMRLNEGSPIAVDDVMIQDTNNASKIIQAQKQINDKLKRIGQVQNEILILKQQIDAIKQQDIQAQKANSKVAEKPKAPEAAPAQPGQQAAAPAQESLVPSLDDFLNEDEEDRFVPHFEDPTGRVWIAGKPRFMKTQKRVEKPYDRLSSRQNKSLDLYFKNMDVLMDEIQNISREIKEDQERLNDLELELDNFAGQVGMEVMDLLSTGVTPEYNNVIMGLGLSYREAKDLSDELQNMLEEKESLEKNIRILTSRQNRMSLEHKKWEEKSNRVGVSYRKTYDKIANESINEEDAKVSRDMDEKDEDHFFIQIPAQDEEEGDIIAKVFREEPDSEWYVRDTLNQAEWLDDLVFQSEWEKPEIIDYLANIFGEVEEIDQSEYNETIDNKDELDYDLYDQEEDKDEFNISKEKNVRFKLRK